jgi:hypothetical protein
VPSNIKTMLLFLMCSCICRNMTIFVASRTCFQALPRTRFLGHLLPVVGVRGGGGGGFQRAQEKRIWGDDRNIVARGIRRGENTTLLPSVALDS